MGAVGIGTPTWLIAGALASNRMDLVPSLSNQVQNGVESLKWNTRVNWEVIENIQNQTTLPAFLELGQKQATFLRNPT